MKLAPDHAMSPTSLAYEPRWRAYLRLRRFALHPKIYAPACLAGLNLKVILANCENRDVINAVNAMVFSMAAAELKTSAAADPNLMEQWKAMVSPNLRKLFS